MHKRVLAALLVMRAATPAHAHPGGHDHMAWLEYLGHLAEPFHLGLGALVALLAGVAWARSRRSEAGIPVKSREHDRS